MRGASTRARASCSTRPSSSSRAAGRPRATTGRASSRLEARASRVLVVDAREGARGRARTRARARRGGVDPFEDPFAALERETRTMFETMERETAAARRDAEERARARRRDAARLDGRGDEYSREESGERMLPGGGVHRYYVSERVTTYGTRRPPASAARGAANAAATLVVVAATAAYATMTRRFLCGYDRTSYKDEVKTSVATRWPLLWAASPKFREEFRRATRDDDARGEADAESESEAAQEDVPSVPRDIDR